MFWTRRRTPPANSAKPLKLFEPLQIGSLTLKNRIIMAPMTTNLGAEDGAVTQRLIEYLVERARGGVAMVTLEGVCIDWPLGKSGPSPLGLYDWRFVTGLHELVEAVHREKTCIAVQLTHPGRQTSRRWTEGQQPVAPSPVPCAATGGEEPRALTIEEVMLLLDKFERAALLAQAAGFDAVEVQGGDGHLLAQFLSPLTNQRSDDYGGPLQGRIQFPLQVIQRIKGRLGPEFPLIFRLCGEEGVPGGITPQEMVHVARVLEDAGVDAFCVTSGMYDSSPSPFWRFVPGANASEGPNLYLANRLKPEVEVPVLAVGKLGSLDLAEKSMGERLADGVEIGRGLLADPDLPKKFQEGRASTVRPCIYCNDACFGNVARSWSIQCVVNPRAGREGEYVLPRAAHPKKVMVVGGGPAGLEAARVLAERGHRVTLVEKEEELGGQLRYASQLPISKPLSAYVRYQALQLQRLGVKVLLRATATKELAKKFRPEAIVLAVGSEVVLPKAFENGRIAAFTVQDVLAPRGLATLKMNGPVAIIGGGQVGCQTAWYLVERGHQVTIIEPGGELVADANPVTRGYLQHTMANLHVKALTNYRWSRYVPEGIELRDDKGSALVLDVRSVVFVGNTRPVVQPSYELQGMAPELYLVGDCDGAGTLQKSIHQAFHLARRL